jgi:hypothetical protein
MAAPRRLFFAQPNLIDRHSHYYGEALGWQAACRARGIDARFYIHATAQPALVKEFDARPVFLYETDRIIDTDPLTAHLGNFLLGAGSFASGCGDFARDGINGDDTVVVTYATERDLYGAACWLARCAPEARPQFVFIFHTPDFSWRLDAEGDNLAGDFSRWRFATRQLKAVLPPEKLLLFAAPADLARALAPMIDYPCIASPMPTFYIDDAVLAPIAAQLPRVNIRMAGEFRVERGAELAIDVMLRVATQRPGTSFGLQLARQEEAQAVARLLEPLDATRSLCRIHWGQMEHADYQARLQQSDILLLPYQPERYTLRSSGVFSEAMAYGIVTIVPDRSWMATKLREGWGAGTVFREWTVDSIVTAAMEAIDNYGALAAKARSRAMEWRRRNCAAALLDEIAARFDGKAV